MFVLGLTGSIGMGKSVTAAIFREAGIPVHDSDAAVHALYRAAAVPLVVAAFPGTLRDGEIDRTRLSAYVVNDPAALARLEAIVHPLVRAERAEFAAEARASGADLIVLDIPLLFETGCEGEVDAVLLVTAPEDVQKARVAGRPGMTEAKLAAIIAKQMPDIDKRRRADMILDTSLGHEEAARQVRKLIDDIRAGRVARHHA
ncbi:MAG: dephospho-CoA kinase [Methylovirgula sp.]|uniref:dephospho-CoA kinase n=1 Tax=Methylovirgula sp. TaxID=1978224 RepID=UPI003076632C